MPRPRPRSTLLEDVENRVSERHQQWKRDAVALYEMAELSPADCMQDIFLILLIEAVQIGSLLRMTREEFLTSVGASYDLAIRFRAKLAEDGQ